MTRSIRVLGVNAPVTCKERSQASGVRQRRQEVIPANVLTARFRNSDVNQVTRPGQRADTEQTSQVVVEARFSILKPRQAGAELGLKVQPTCKQQHSRQHQQEDSSLIQVSVCPHPLGVPPVIHPRVSNIHRIRSTCLGESIYCRSTELRVPNRVSDRADI